MSSREVTHLVPQFPLWYPGVNFKDSYETKFIYVKHSAQSLADGSRDLSVRGETHTQYKSGRQDRGREAGSSLGFPSARLDAACANTPEETRAGPLTLSPRGSPYPSGEAFDLSS